MRSTAQPLPAAAWGILLDGYVHAGQLKVLTPSLPSPSCPLPVLFVRISSSGGTIKRKRCTSDSSSLRSGGMRFLLAGMGCLEGGVSPR